MFKRLITLLIVTTAILAFPKAVLGFGITPAEINVQNLKPGGHYETEIYLTRPVSEAGEILKVVLEPNLGKMDGWFNYLPGKEFDFPAGKNTTSFKVVIDVPENVAFDNFKGQITAKGLPSTNASEGITIIKGAVLGVSVATSDVDIKNLKVLSMKAPDVNSGDPVRLLINIKNLGNSAAAPDRVDLKIMDLFEKPLEDLTDSTLEKIDPLSTKEIKAEFNSNLDKGQYRIDASVIFQNKEIARQKMVLTVNAKPAKVEEVGVKQPVTQYVVNQSRLTGLLLVTLGAFILTLIILLHFRKLTGKDDDLEKRLAKLVHENKLISWFLLGASFVLITAGIYFYLSSNLLFGNRVSVVKDQSNDAKDITPTVTPTNLPTKKVTPVPATRVKGASTEVEEPNKAFVVSQPGKPGLYPVFSGPSFDSKIIYEAKSGETFKVIKQVGDWYNVILDDGTSGWLHKTSIKQQN